MEDLGESPILCRQSRDLIVRLRKYFAKECQNGGPLLPLHLILERVAHALRIDIGIVEDINLEYEKQKAKANLKKLMTENEKRNVQSLIIHTNNFFKENPAATRGDLVTSLKKAGLFTGAYSTLHDLLVKSSYRIVKQQAKKILKPTATVTSGSSSVINDEENRQSNDVFQAEITQDGLNDYEIMTSIDVKPLDDEKPDITHAIDFSRESMQIDKMIINSLTGNPEIKTDNEQKEVYVSDSSTISADPEDVTYFSDEDGYSVQNHKKSSNPLAQLDTRIYNTVDNIDVNINSKKFQTEERAYQKNLQAIVRHINEFYSLNRRASQNDLMKSLKQAGLYEGSYSALFMMVLQKSSYKSVIAKKLINEKEVLAKRNKLCEMINSDHEYLPLPEDQKNKEIPEITLQNKEKELVQHKQPRKDSNETEKKKKYRKKKALPLRDQIQHAEPESKSKKKIMRAPKPHRRDAKPKIQNKRYPRRDVIEEIINTTIKDRSEETENISEYINREDRSYTAMPLKPLRVFSKKSPEVKTEPAETSELNYMQVDNFIDFASNFDDPTIKEEFNSFDEFMDIEDPFMNG